MRKYIISLILSVLLLSVLASAEVYYVSLTKHDKGLSYSGVRIGEGQAPTPLEEGRFSAEVMDLNGKVRYSTNFDYTIGQFELTLPYFANGERIVIKEGNKNLYEVSTSHFLEVCGDRKCQVAENHLLCPRDCPSGGEDNFCDKKEDGKCDPDCLGNDVDCVVKEEVKEVEQIPVPEIVDTKTPEQAQLTLVESSQKEIPIYPIILIIVVVLILLIMVIVHHVHKKHLHNEIREYFAKYSNYPQEQIKMSLLKQGYKEKDIDRVIGKAL